MDEHNKVQTASDEVHPLVQEARKRISGEFEPTINDPTLPEAVRDAARQIVKTFGVPAEADKNKTA